jgi:hypothetical protein
MEMKDFSVYFMEGKDLRVNAKLIFIDSATFSQRANKREVGQPWKYWKTEGRKVPKEFQ